MFSKHHAQVFTSIQQSIAVAIKTSPDWQSPAYLQKPLALAYNPSNRITPAASQSASAATQRRPFCETKYGDVQRGVKDGQMFLDLPRRWSSFTLLPLPGNDKENNK